MENIKNESRTHQTLIGVDYGRTNIGIALGRNDLVFPIRTIAGKNTQYAVQEITKTALQNKVDAFVVGLPLTLDGKETQEAKEVRKFAKILKIISRKPVIFQEEYGTSREAMDLALELQTGRKSRRINDH